MKKPSFKDVNVEYAKKYLKLKELRIDGDRYLSLDDLIETWEDHHRAKGTDVKDYLASFRNWIRSGLKYGGIERDMTYAQQLKLEEGIEIL